MSVGLAVADDSLDGGSALELAFDLAVDATLLSGTVDPERLWGIVALVALIDIGAFDLAAGKRLGLLDDFSQGMAVVGVSGQRLGVEDELPALAAFVCGGQRDLDAELLLEPGDQVWVEDPGFVSGRNVLLSIGLEVAPIPADEDGLSLSAGLARAPGARMVHLCPSKHFPLGMTMPVARRLEFLAWAREAGAWILENDYDNEFPESDRALPAMASFDRDRTIYLGNFSNSLAEGLCLSYVVVPASLVAAMTRVAYMEQGLSPIIQRVLLRFIEEGYYTRHIRRIRHAYHIRENTLARLLTEEASDYLVPRPMGSGFCFLADLAPGWDDIAIEESAARRKITAYALSGFCLDPSNLPAQKALVLGYACVPPAEMTEAVSRFCAAIEETRAQVRVSAHRA